MKKWMIGIVLVLMLGVVVMMMFCPSEKTDVKVPEQAKEIACADTVDSIIEEPDPVIEIDDKALGLRQNARPITEIVIHCSATGDDYDYPIDSVVKSHRMRGFRAIGYHYYITKDGVVHKGRDLKVKGAHVSGHNATTIGVCYEGGLRRAKRVKGMGKIRIPDELKDKVYACFQTEVGKDTIVATAIRGVAYVSYDTRTKAQKMAITELVEHLKAIYPRARVCGHRDYSPDRNHDGVISPRERIKDCPSYDVRCLSEK